MVWVFLSEFLIWRVKEWQVEMKEVRMEAEKDARKPKQRWWEWQRRHVCKKTHEESSHNHEKHGGEGSAHDDQAGPSTSRVGDVPEPNDDGSHQSKSENDRGSSESSNQNPNSVTTKPKTYSNSQ